MIMGEAFFQRSEVLVAQGLRFEEPWDDKH